MFKIFCGSQKDSPSYVKSWIKQICENQNYSWLVPIEESWAGDWFNQHGIKDNFDRFDQAIELITEKKTKEWSYYTEEECKLIHSQAIRIYGLLHARWICQPKGMELMKEKYEKGFFGKCPRTLCDGCNLIPIGTTLVLRRHSVKLFCPKCYDIYRAPPYPIIDGGFFGPAFPHMFLCEYTTFNKSHLFIPFIQKAFGFKIRKDNNSRKPIHNRNNYEFDFIQEIE